MPGTVPCNYICTVQSHQGMVFPWARAQAPIFTWCARNCNNINMTTVVPTVMQCVVCMLSTSWPNCILIWDVHSLQLPLKKSFPDWVGGSCSCWCNGNLEMHFIVFMQIIGSLGVSVRHCTGTLHPALTPDPPRQKISTCLHILYHTLVCWQ